MNAIPPLAEDLPPRVDAPGEGAPSTSLGHLSLLRVAGADAATFLDSQLTRNVPDAAPAGSSGPASLAGYCSPKGRLLATFVTWADADGVGLILSRDIAAAIAKRLRMYVLRAKATVEDVTASRRLEGLVGSSASPAAVEALLPWQTVEVDARRWIRYPDAGDAARYLRIGPLDEADSAAVDARRWRWLDIRSGLPSITTATQDRFVPQMLNLEALGAVDFRKGCFPGQEVVARSQYLGKLKRRMARASIAGSATLPEPGSDVWAVGDHEPRGIVVDAERGADVALNGGADSGPDRIALLVELPLASFDAADLRVGSPDGAPLTIEALPYELPDNEVFVRPKL